MSALTNIKLLNLTPDTEISNAASKFLEQVKALMGQVQNNASEQTAGTEEEALSALYQGFFEYAMQWAGQERGKNINQQNHPDAAALKEAASEALNDLQDNIIAFALCYMRLGRSMGLINQKISEYEQKSGAAKNIEWTSDTGVVLGRYKKEKRMLQESNTKLIEGLKVVKEAEKHFTIMEKAAEKTFGKSSLDDVMRPLRSNLRSGAFDKARKSLSAIGRAKRKFALDKKAGEKNIQTIQDSGRAYIDILEEGQENLVSADQKMFLKSAEINIVIDVQEKEIEQKDKFIKKYHRPYMEYKLKSLQHLREKLLVVGSLESFMTLYIRLMRGLAEPLLDTKTVREYESEVIDHVNYLLGGQFQEVANIEKWNVETLKEFFENLSEFSKPA